MSLTRAVVVGSALLTLAVPASANILQKPGRHVVVVKRAATPESRARDARNAAIKAREDAIKAKEEAAAAEQKMLAEQAQAREDAEKARLADEAKAAKARAEAREVNLFSHMLPGRGEPVLPRIGGRMPTPEDVPYTHPVAAKP